MRRLSKAFKALSDSNRIRILKMLEIRPLCVCEITEVLGLAASTVSKHLSILRDAEFILDNKDGKWVNYYLNDKNDNEVIEYLLPLIKLSLPDEDTIKNDAQKVSTVDRNTLCGI
ncbi:MAG: winged helix-turn-helix transcriptional regulator [Calditrichaceae bacterium]|nr:winged helix-turn-helix transcriptional regulator [Calditrichaceae bacterium]HES60259.1 ArsR family transcriptional regulator [Caldithrix sp.]